MPLLAALAAIVAGLAIWYWRLKMMKEAGDQVIDSVERMRGAYKRKQFRKKAEEAPLASIREPAIAAVTFFMCLANEKPAHKDLAKAVIRDRMSGIIAARDMDEVLIFADWTAKSVINTEDPVRRFRELWVGHLSAAELQELVSIAEAVCDVGGGPNDDQMRALQVLKRRIYN